MRCWPNGDECKALGAANSSAYSQAEQHRRRAVWPQPEGTGRFGGIPLLPAAGSGRALRRGRRLGLPPKAPPSHTRQ